MTTRAGESGASVRRCAVCKIDLKGRFVYVDESTEQLTGYTKEELFGKSFLDFVAVSSHPVIERILHHRNHYETYFDSTHLEIVNRTHETIAATVIISLNFIAGNPVNFQIIIDPQAPPAQSQAPTAAPTASLFESFALSLMRLTAEDFVPGFAIGLSELFGPARTAIYPIVDGKLVDDLLPPGLMLSESPALNPLHHWVAESGETYFAASPDNVRRAIERTGAAPNEYLSRLSLADNRQFLIRVLFEEHADPSEVHAAVGRFEAALSLVQRLSSSPAATPVVQGRRELVKVDEILDRAGIACCLLDSDGSVRPHCTRFAELFGDAAVIRHRSDLVAALAPFNSPTLIHQLADRLESNRQSESHTDWELTLYISDGKQMTILAGETCDDQTTPPRWLLFTTVGEHSAGRTHPGFDSATMKVITRELGSSLAAACRIADRLSHEYFDELSREGNYYLTCLGEKLRKLEAMLEDISQAVKTLAESESPQLLDLNLTVATLFDETTKAHPGVTVTGRYQALPKILVPSRKVTAILRYLIDNSVTFTRTPSVEISVKAEVEPGKCQITIADSGPGIPPRFLKHVADFFYRSPEPSVQALPGHGCGLAVARLIAINLGGSLEIDSVRDKGATVRITIPLLGG